MKKLFLAVVLCVVSAAVSAQVVKSFDAKVNMRGDWGIGAGVTMDLGPVDFAPSFNLYFPDHGTVFTVDGDFHYNFDVAPQWTIYPLAGLVWYHADADGEGYDKLGMNFGLGGKFDLDDRWAINAEAKYQVVKHFDDTFFSLGVNYKF